MTHRSRLTSVLVDVPADEHDTAATFWSAALGREGKRYEKFPEYVGLHEPTPGIEFMVQATGDDSPRIHIDIESDDVDAEVARLTKLGAAEIERHHTWVVMRDPVGIVFCVVRVQQPAAFEANATTWD
jgi:predicted enzyme related to lactoylglutathione lyase